MKEKKKKKLHVSRQNSIDLISEMDENVEKWGRIESKMIVVWKC